MVPTLQRCARLVAALEDLAGQESAAITARDFELAAMIQERTSPLILDLASRPEEINEPTLQTRIAAVRERRNATMKWLADELMRAKDALRETETAQRCAAIVAPAYRSKRTDTASKLCCVG